MHHRTMLPRRSVRLRLADTAGSLERVTRIVAAHDVNVVRLEIASWEQTDVWDDIEMTAMSDRQLDGVVRALEDDGMTVLSLPRTWVMRDWALEVLDALEHMAMCGTPAAALEAFTTSSRVLARTEHAFVLMARPNPDPNVSDVRLQLLRSAARAIRDPSAVTWSGDAVRVSTVVRALAAVGSASNGVTDDDEAAGAVAPFPAPFGQEALLVVVGVRPPFLEAERRRIEVFARVAAPHLGTTRMENSA